jgi:excisionase family DNA binding protein
MRNPSTQIAPAMLTIQDAAKYAGFSRSRIYEEMNAGRLDARKAGRRTLISRASLDDLLASLPRAATKAA